MAAEVEPIGRFFDDASDPKGISVYVSAPCFRLVATRAGLWSLAAVHTYSKFEEATFNVVELVAALKCYCVACVRTSAI